MLHRMRRRLTAALFWALGIKPPTGRHGSARRPFTPVADDVGRAMRNLSITGPGGSVPAMRRVPGASGHRPGASWASDVARGPLTRFSTGDPVHDCGSGHVCARLGCFERQPYVSLRDRQQEGDSSC